VGVTICIVLFIRNVFGGRSFIAMSLWIGAPAIDGMFGIS
jgi:hypothetical protein